MSLPWEIWTKIILYCDGPSYKPLRLVSKSFKELIDENAKYLIKSPQYLPSPSIDLFVNSEEYSKDCKYFVYLCKYYDLSAEFIHRLILIINNKDLDRSLIRNQELTNNHLALLTARNHNDPELMLLLLRHKLSIKTLQKYKGYVDWRCLSTMPRYITISFCEKFANLLCWKTISKLPYIKHASKFFKRFEHLLEWRLIIKYNTKLKTKHLIEHEDWISFLDVSRERPCLLNNIYLLRKHKEVIDWAVVSVYCKLTDEMIEEFYDRLDWGRLSLNQPLSERIVFKYIELIDWNKYSANPNILENIIALYPNRINWVSLSKNPILLPEIINKWWRRLYVMDITRYNFYFPNELWLLFKYCNAINWKYLCEQAHLTLDTAIELLYNDELKGFININWLIRNRNFNLPIRVILHFIKKISQSSIEYMVKHHKITPELLLILYGMGRELPWENIIRKRLSMHYKFFFIQEYNDTLDKLREQDFNEAHFYIRNWIRRDDAEINYIIEPDLLEEYKDMVDWIFISRTQPLKLEDWERFKDVLDIAVLDKLKANQNILYN